MKITLPMAGTATLEFASLEELAQHYSKLSNWYLNEASKQRTLKEARYCEGNAYAYSSVAWQIGRMQIDNTPAPVAADENIGSI